MSFELPVFIVILALVFTGGFSFGCAAVIVFVKGADAKIKRLQELN